MAWAARRPPSLVLGLLKVGLLLLVLQSAFVQWQPAEADIQHYLPKESNDGVWKSNLEIVYNTSKSFAAGSILNENTKTKSNNSIETNGTYNRETTHYPQRVARYESYYRMDDPLGSSPNSPPEMSFFEKDVPNVSVRVPANFDPYDFEDHRFNLLSWGPGYVFSVGSEAFWYGAYSYKMDYARMFSGNATSVGVPPMIKYAAAGEVVRVKKWLYSYPGVTCPYWLKKNVFCMLWGQQLLTHPWQKFSDWVNSVQFWNYNNSQDESGFEHMDIVFSIIDRYEYNFRVFQCDPTLDCFPLPGLEDEELAFPWSTTSQTPPKSQKFTKKTSTQEHTTGASRTPVSEILTEGWRHLNDLRNQARRWWPLLFVLCLIALFFVLPLLYITAKRKAEREAVERWYHASSPDERVHFLIQVPPAWPPGWPPGPREPRESRTTQDASGAGGAGEMGGEEPPAKRPRT